MRVKKMVTLLLILLMVGTNLVACNKPNNKSIEASSETKYYSITIDGDKMYYGEDSKEVGDAIQLVNEYISYATTANYNNEESLKEFDYYTDAIKAENEKYGSKESIKAMISEYKLIIELLSYEISNIEFYKTNGAECAQVTCDYISVIKNATDEYFEERGLEKDTKYKRNMVINIMKEDNKWKAVEYSLGKREKVN